MNKIEQIYQELDEIDNSTLEGQQRSDEILNSLNQEEKENIIDLIQENAIQENFLRQPIYNEKEYKELDPDGLVKDFYEKEIKGKELDEPEWLKGKVRISDDGYWGKNRRLKVIPEAAYWEIIRHAAEVSSCILYFSGDKELAQEVIKKNFDLINNSVGNAELKPHDGGCCICQYAEELGLIAAGCGFRELQKEIITSVMCFSSPQYQEYRPALGVQSFRDEDKIETLEETKMSAEKIIKERIKRLAKN